MNLYSKIVNPVTGRKVLVNSRLGKKILRQYLEILIGGAGPAIPFPIFSVSDDIILVAKLANIVKNDDTSIIPHEVRHWSEPRILGAGPGDEEVEYPYTIIQLEPPTGVTALTAPTKCIPPSTNAFLLLNIDNEYDEENVEWSGPGPGEDIVDVIFRQLRKAKIIFIHTGGAEPIITKFCLQDDEKDTIYNQVAEVAEAAEAAGVVLSHPSELEYLINLNQIQPQLSTPNLGEQMTQGAGSAPLRVNLTMVPKGS